MVSGAKKEIVLPVSIKYEDTNKKKYEQKADLKLRIFDSSEISAFGLKKKSYFLPALGVLVLAVLGFIYYRSRKKQR